MWLYQVMTRAGELRWVVQREEGAGFEMVRRRVSRSPHALFEALMSGESLPCKRAVEALPGALCVPVAPSKIVCVGLNYRAHAAEMGKPLPEEPLLFLKPTTALLAPGGEIELPVGAGEVHHEGELVVVVGRTLRNATVEEAEAGILGYTCGNDVTARAIQRREQRYTRAKGFDTFAPLGPCVRLASSGFEVGSAYVECRVNGEVRQRSGLDDVIFGVGEVLSFISRVMTLLPGDVVYTGTPSGVGELRGGDVVEVEVSGVGVLRNRVVEG